MRLRILVGNPVPSITGEPVDELVDVIHVRTCREVFPRLRRASEVDLVISDTDLKLPDGTWRDLVQMVASRRIPGTLRVIRRDGQTVFRCVLGSGDTPDTL